KSAFGSVGVLILLLSLVGAGGLITTLSSHNAAVLEPIVAAHTVLLQFAGPTSTLTVSTQDSTGNAIAGLYVSLNLSSTTVATGYSPVNFTLNSNTLYSVKAWGFQSHVFDHWLDSGSTA